MAVAKTFLSFYTFTLKLLCIYDIYSLYMAALGGMGPHYNLLAENILVICPELIANHDNLTML